MVLFLYQQEKTDYQESSLFILDYRKHKIWQMEHYTNINY